MAQGVRSGARYADRDRRDRRLLADLAHAGPLLCGHSPATSVPRPVSTMESSIGNDHRENGEVKGHLLTNNQLASFVSDVLEPDPPIRLRPVLVRPSEEAREGIAFSRQATAMALRAEAQNRDTKGNRKAAREALQCAAWITGRAVDRRAGSSWRDRQPDSGLRAGRGPHPAGLLRRSSGLWLAAAARRDDDVLAAAFSDAGTRTDERRGLLELPRLSGRYPAPGLCGGVGSRWHHGRVGLLLHGAQRLGDELLLRARAGRARPLPRGPGSSRPPT
jgi:hypothetical protein